MPNRNPVKQLFITFPKSNVDKNTFRDSLLQFQPSFYKVVEEKHKDGTPHLHAIVKFTNKYSVSHVLKKFKEIYPNDYKRIDVEPVRSISKALEYLSKEDQMPLSSGVYVENRGGTNFRSSAAKALGYSSPEQAIKEITAEQLWIQHNEGRVHKMHTYLSGYPEYSLPFQIRRYLDKPYKTKDDITFLLKHFKMEPTLP